MGNHLGNKTRQHATNTTMGGCISMINIETKL